MVLNTTIFNFLYFIIQYISYTPFILLTSKTCFESKKCVLFALFNALISSVLNLVLPTSYTAILDVFYILLVYITSILIFDMDKYSSLVLTIVCSLILFVTNILCLSFNIPTFSNHYTVYKSIIFLIVISAFYKFLCAHTVKNFINYLKSSHNIFEIYFLALIILFSYNFTYITNIEISYTFLLVQTFLTLFVLQTINSKYDIEIVKLSLKNKNFEYNKLKSIVDDIRMFKHDYNNTLCSIGGYISLNDMNGLKNFYTKLTSDITKTNNTQMINPKNINEPSIYNILVSKYNDIIKKNLSFKFYSAINYKKINISPYDFSKILGIFLDNAIDAANQTIEKEVSLYCEMNKNKDYEVIIKNSYINKEVEIEKIFLKGYSSKTVKSGLGLWEVSKILKAYPNISLHTEKNSNYFIQKMIISS